MEEARGAFCGERESVLPAHRHWPLSRGFLPVWSSLEGPYEVPLAAGNTAGFQALRNPCTCMSGLPARVVWGRGGSVWAGAGTWGFSLSAESDGGLLVVLWPFLLCGREMARVQRDCMKPSPSSSHPIFCPSCRASALVQRKMSPLAVTGRCLPGFWCIVNVYKY